LASPQTAIQPLHERAVQMALPAALAQLAVELVWQQEAQQPASPLREERPGEAAVLPPLSVE